MLVQCRNCQKVLEIDQAKLTRDVMRGACPACGAIIEVSKPGPGAQKPMQNLAQSAGNQAEATADPGSYFMEEENYAHKTDFIEEANPAPDPATKAPLKPSREGERRKSGFTIWKKLLLLFFLFILITGGGITFLYLTYVPSLMYEQISLRTFSIARAFSGAIHQSLLVKNYLLVNQTAANNAKLPHVAYISVLNKRGVVIAGIFGNKENFSPDFRAQIEKTGFPKELSSKNRLPANTPQKTLNFTAGGQKIHDVAVSVADTGAEVHVGIFTADVKHQVHKSLLPLLVFLSAIILVGSFCFYMVSRSISKPIKNLTLAAEKISTGEMTLPIRVKGGGEIGELAESLERMRFSINTAMDRLMQQS